MGVLDRMCLVDDWNFWKNSLDVVLSKSSAKGNFLYCIMSNIFHGGNEVTSFSHR